MPARTTTKKQPKPRLIAVVGPTASGKTKLAIALAKKFKGEVVSADSRQVFRGMRVTSGLPPGKWSGRGAKRAYYAAGIAHHLVDFIEPGISFTLVDWLQKAEQKIVEISERGRLPIVCGGTGLYVRALLHGFAPPAVPPDEKFRAELANKTTAQLFSQLQQHDPEYARRITPQNRRYITRALEVIHATGRPFSRQQGSAAPAKRRYDALVLGLNPPRGALQAAIARRIEEQARTGLLREAKRLLAKFGHDDAAVTALGVRQLASYFAGQVSRGEAIEIVKKSVRDYAKRQETWFGRDRDIVWCSSASQAQRAARKFLKGK